MAQRQDLAATLLKRNNLLITILQLVLLTSLLFQLSLKQQLAQLNPVKMKFHKPVAGLWYSSVAIYQAVANAFSGISVYQGAHTSAMCEASDYCEYDEEELTVDVYVKADKIVTLGLGADGQSTASYATNWAGKVEAIITVYQDVLVSAINAMSDPAELYGETSAAAGVTYSGDRLFFAVQNALEGYGA